MLKRLAELRVIKRRIRIGPSAGPLRADVGAEAIRSELPDQGAPLRQRASRADGGRTRATPPGAVMIGSLTH